MSSSPRLARHRIDITIQEPLARSLSKAWLRGVVHRVLAAEGVPPAELSIAIVDEETIRRLNRDYSGADEATDVLSFSLAEGEPFVSPTDDVLPLGEVVIAYPVAVRQAVQRDHTVEREVAHLLIHGILHLLGYDHAEAEEERRMRAKEEALLGAVMPSSRPRPAL